MMSPGNFVLLSWERFRLGFSITIGCLRVLPEYSKDTLTVDNCDDEKGFAFFDRRTNGIENVKDFSTSYLTPSQNMSIHSNVSTDIITFVFKSVGW